MRVDDRVTYTPKKGKKRQGVVVPGFVDTTTHVKVKLDGDPFPVDLPLSQVSSCKNVPNGIGSKHKVPKAGTKKHTNKERKSMTTATKPNAKALRKQAQALGIEGWEDMSRAEMAKAIKRAKRSETEEKAPKSKPTKGKAKAAPKTKPAAKPAAKAKAATKKAVNGTKKSSKPEAPAGSDAALGLTFAKVSPPKPLPDEGVNPFRKSSNLFVVGNLLLKGGSRRTLAEKLSQKVDLHPYNKDSGDIDLLDFDKRLLLGAQTMRDQFGYGIQRTGRGLEGKILVFRPGGDKDPRGKNAGRKATKSATKKAAGKAKGKR